MFWQAPDGKLGHALVMREGNWEAVVTSIMLELPQLIDQLASDSEEDGNDWSSEIDFPKRDDCDSWREN